MVLVLFLVFLSSCSSYSDEFAPVDLRHQMLRLKALEPVLSDRFLRVEFQRQKSGEPVLMNLHLSPAYLDLDRDWRNRLKEFLRHILPKVLTALQQDCPPILESVPLLSRLRCRIYIGQSLYGVWVGGHLEIRQGIY